MISLIVLGFLIFFGLRIFLGLFGWLFKILGILIVGGLILAFASSFIGIFAIVVVVLLGSWIVDVFSNN
ncbi:hypothetical protein IWT140_01680 [Secundilactobacillus pentosiphilus]|uniref:Uncharacterized protein n=1 Tax=Secundilactobacillus pentosiphilus TaxID=1714682 RepID=A0A1Z5IXA4_9LACO|nr:hypothetical protein [Secundilactobacillus pentosiphilus]GAX04045.1 hypothetical protein IWT140_01680 [Secundilactobacillus pentosiphilus]GAX06218.1 hypothetical protein IWT25_01543 [Secundilactobacillus pentosiphilus]